MKRLIKIFGMRINSMQCSWWLFWEEVFLKRHIHSAFNRCSHNFRKASYKLSLKLYERVTGNW